MYSANRVKYPMIRGRLLKQWREAKSLAKSPVDAWANLVEAGNSKIMSDQTVNKYGLRAYTKLIVVATMYKNRSFAESVDDTDRILISETALTMARVLSKSFEPTVFVPQDDLGRLYQAHKMKKIRA
jgi:hypothetical protein